LLKICRAKKIGLCQMRMSDSKYELQEVPLTT
jgi:hypothetical protein